MKTNIENNKLIAEFMGWSLIKAQKMPQYVHNVVPELLHPEDFRYNSSWDWLMPVVEKIESIEIKIGKNTTDYFDVWIMPDCIRIQYQSDENNPLIIINKSESIGSINHELYLFENKLDATYNAIVEFIKWYNNEYSNIQRA